jgi:transketolase
LIDMPTIKPIDRDAILASARRARLLLTVEEHNTIGGLGGAVAEVLADAGVPAPPTHLYRHYRLDAAGIEAVARAVLA